ncbi:PAS domain S-box protein [Herbaspirillum sp. YR522]|uniref:PAS domain S-box protein n=1 Tax=Herbaspirillum sp. YR522 TaxID=1144342 RepID=UPI00026F76D2|nr:PAS domain S-box protein [Herbaspirillum sp. YR522]EJN01233.1 PAS domain S-box/diguanylate cyclase (GGDEF) domain-containing protein [Herbaspirillum sp. YR522]
MPIPYPVEENKRLAVLHSLGLLDSAPDPAFDRVTRLASKLLDVPISLISLLDAERQWFKSRVGLEVEQTPRSQAFCAYTIMEESSLVVPDAINDARFRDNPLVLSEPSIRFYAGVPIRSNEGLPIGTLCVLDSKPKTLKPEELELLQDLASIVTKEIQLIEGLLDTHDQLALRDARLADNEHQFRSVFELARVGIALIDGDGRWLKVNKALCRIVGYSASELMALTFQDITHPDDLDTDLHLLQQLIKGEIGQYHLEKRYLRHDGSEVWINLGVSKKLRQDGTLDYFISVVQDIHAEKQARLELAALHRELEQKVVTRTDELRKRETELTAVLENASDAYIRLDHAGRVTAWNREAEHLFGWLAGEALERMPQDLIVPRDDDTPARRQWIGYLEHGLHSLLVRRQELQAMHKDGRIFPVEVRMRALAVNGQRIGIMFLHDITERKHTEALREHEIRHDALTGLINRRALNDMLPLAQERARRHRTALYVLFIDLDGFKRVNDEHGHEAGDLVLQAVALRLRTQIRQTDSAFRLAGDEFVVLLEGPHHTVQRVAEHARALIDAVSQPVPDGDRELRVGASIGIGVQEVARVVTPEQLMREADACMYEAKSRGKGTVCF